MSDIVRRLFGCGVRAVEGRPRTLRFVASTENVARDEDVILVDGWNLDNFRANPSILWAHDHRTPAIGRAVDVRKVTDGERRLEVDIEFAGLAEEHDLAEQVYQLASAGFLGAVSVGFLAKAHRKPDEEEREARKMGRFGRIVEQAELIEVSLVNVPADPGALALSGANVGELREAVAVMRSAATEEQGPRWDALEAAIADPEEWEAKTVTTSGLSSICTVRPFSPTKDDIRAIVRDELKTVGADISVSVETTVRSLIAELQSSPSTAKLPDDSRDLDDAEDEAPDPRADGWDDLASALRERSE